MQELLDFASGHGFSPPSIVLDGTIHRFDRNGKKNAWYVGWQNHAIKGGEVYQVAVFGDWKTKEEITYKPTKKLSREDSSVIKASLDQAKAKAQLEREMKQRETKSVAEDFWNKGTHVFDANGLHPYLLKKKLGSLYGAKVFQQMIMVPMVDKDGSLWGIQRIYQDGGKFFLTGQRAQGLFHLIGDEPETQAFICEGYATGATIHEATKQPVYCAFSAHNLIEVAKLVRKSHPHLTITVCADDDRFSETNAGRQAGEKAALSSLADLCFPIFAEGSKGTDFNDLYLEQGLDVVVRQLTKIEDQSESRGFVPLGYDEGVHLFYAFASKNIVKISSFSDVQMLQLMPLSYWQNNYISKTGINWIGAKNDLIQLSTNVGPFDSSSIRGTGVWLDRGRTVVNTGHNLIVNKEPNAYSKFRSGYVYVRTKNRMPLIHTEPLTYLECHHLTRACEKPKWKLEKSGKLLAGWIALARIAGSLPIRPHIWITGSSGTGKSTVLDGLIRPALGHPSSRLYLQGGSTEAGIRQSVKADSLPLLFDEFESNGPQSADRMAAIIELLRQSWSQTQGNIIKGSASGFAQQYSLSFAAMLSSIRVTLDNDADRSRFSVLELLPHGNDKEHLNSLIQLLKFIDEDYGERLFARSIGQVTNILRSYEIFKDALAKSISQRFGQQYGMLLAGYQSLISDTATNQALAEQLVDSIDWGDEREEAKETDHNECWTHLLTSKVQIKENVQPYTTFDWPIGEILTKVDGYLNQLKNYGILVDSEFIFVSGNHSELGKIFRGTRWAKGWAKSLARLPGAVANQPKWLNSNNARCTKIPLALIKQKKELGS